MKKITGSVLVCAGAGLFATVALLTNPLHPTTAAPTNAAAAPASVVVAPPATAADGGPVDAGGHPGHVGASTAPAPGPAPSAATGATLRISNFAFEAPTVAPGATVTVTNADPATHTVTAQDGSFDVTVPANGTATFTAPNRPGSFAFFCEIHPNMSATLVVR